MMLELWRSVGDSFYDAKQQYWVKGKIENAILFLELSKGRIDTLISALHKEEKREDDP